MIRYWRGWSYPSAIGYVSCHAIIDEARRYVARIRERLPGYNVEEFLRAFRFDKDGERMFRGAARSIDVG